MNNDTDSDLESLVRLLINHEAEPAEVASAWIDYIKSGSIASRETDLISTYESNLKGCFVGLNKFYKPAYNAGR